MARCTGEKYVGRTTGGNHSNFVPCTDEAMTQRTETGVVRVVDGKLTFGGTIQHSFCSECASFYDSMMAEREFERMYS